MIIKQLGNTSKSNKLPSGWFSEEHVGAVSFTKLQQEKLMLLTSENERK